NGPTPKRATAARESAAPAAASSGSGTGSEAGPLRSRGGAASCVARRASRGEFGSSTAGGEFGSATSDGAVELEVAGQERQPVEEHRDADGHDERPANRGHEPPVPDERRHHARGAVVDRRDRDEWQPEAERVR